MQVCLVTINVTQPKSQTDTEIETVVQSQYRIIRIDLCDYTFVCARTFIYLLSVLYVVRKNKPKSKRWFNGVFLSVKQNQMGNRFLNKVHHWGILLDVIQCTLKKSETCNRKIHFSWKSLSKWCSVSFLRWITVLRLPEPTYTNKPDLFQKFRSTSVNLELLKKKSKVWVFWGKSEFIEVILDFLRFFEWLKSKSNRMPVTYEFCSVSTNF